MAFMIYVTATLKPMKRRQTYIHKDGKAKYMLYNITVPQFIDKPILKAIRVPDTPSAIMSL